MKISQVRTAPIPQRGNARRTAIRTGPCDLRVEVLTDEGLSGVSFTHSAASRAAIDSIGSDLLIGQDPRGTYGLWERMSSALQNSGELAEYRAASALDIALWDLKAKTSGEPLWKTVGGSRQRVKAHGAGFGLDLGEKALEQRCRIFSNQFGIKDLMLEAGPDPDANLHRLSLVSGVLQESDGGQELMLRFGRQQSPVDSVNHVRRLESRYSLNWVEGVCSDRDFLGLRRLSRQIGSAVCAGGELYRVDDFLPLFKHYAANIVMLDPNQIGITATLQLADAAFGLELPVNLASTPGNWAAQLAAAMPSSMSVEVCEPDWPENLLVSDVQIVDGWCRVGDAPGLGLVAGA